MRIFSAICTVVLVHTVSIALYAQQDKATTLRTNVLGTGISYSVSDVTQGRPSLMLSALYERQVASWAAFEIALHSLGASTLTYTAPERPANAVNGVLGNGFVNRSITGDISFFLQPFTGTAAEGLRFGVGLSLRWFSGMRSEFDIHPHATNGTIFPTQYALFTEGMNMGGNVKIEYLFPVTESVELAARAQLQLFGDSFQGVGTVFRTTSVPGAFGGGIICRMRL